MNTLSNLYVDTVTSVNKSDIITADFILVSDGFADSIYQSYTEPVVAECSAFTDII